MEWLILIGLIVFGILARSFAIEFFKKSPNWVLWVFFGIWIPFMIWVIATR
ncbi:MAG: hypothetical protein QGF90_12535 [Gammaproteobacteria bacterium]|jgi:hypothetical protein|nr:hypothetical protein [Gammaproteobacteria bacterium]